MPEPLHGSMTGLLRIYWHVAHMENLQRNSKALAERYFYLQVEGENVSICRRAPRLLVTIATKSELGMQVVFYKSFMKGQWLTSSQGPGSSLSNVCRMGKKLIFTIWWYFWPHAQLENDWKDIGGKNGRASQSRSSLSPVSILWQMSHPRVLSSLPPNPEEKESGGPAGFQHLELFYMKPSWKLPMGSCSFRRGRSSGISPETWEVLEIKSVGAGGSQTLSFLLWRIIEGPACRLSENNKLNFQSSELVLFSLSCPLPIKIMYFKNHFTLQ